MKIGTYAWMQQSHGRLSFKEKLTLIHQSMLPTLRSSLAMLLHPQQTACVVDFDQIVLPDSAMIRHAMDVLEEQQDLCLLHHSWRSYAHFHVKILVKNFLNCCMMRLSSDRMLE